MGGFWLRRWGCRGAEGGGSIRIVIGVFDLGYWFERCFVSMVFWSRIKDQEEMWEKSI